jgi:hypothetical protein
MDSERSLSRYDLSLAAIALSLVTGSLVGALSPVGMAVALAGGSVPATGTVGYALFYRPPVSV